MSVEKLTDNAVGPDEKWVYRVGGISALVLGFAYIIIFPLFALVGAPPSGGEAWLKYLAGKTTVWWAILALSVLTDFLYVPVALSLYLVLKRINRNAMLLATAFVGLFVVLDLAVTQPRINKGTYRLQEWVQISLHLPWVFDNPRQGPI